MTTRVTQGGGYVGYLAGTGTNDVRVTQAGAYVGFLSDAFGARVTQAGGYVGILSDTVANDVRVTQTGGYVGVRLLRPPCGTTEAQCWRIERTDGEVFLYTAHDEDVPFRGETYSPCASLKSSALQTSAEFGSTENMDLSGIIGDDISVADLWAGRFDGASVEVWRVDWSDPTKAELLAAGRCGALQAGSTSFTFEITTASDRLQQRPILQPVMASCRFKLGDSRCGVDLEALRVTGAVTAVPAVNVQTGALRRIFTDTSRTEADAYFQLGRLTWTSGDNNGLSVDVKSFASDVFILETPMQNEISIGDTYSVTPGDDRRFETCAAKFSNAINFGGYPHLRGTDDLQKTPAVKT